MGCEVRGWLRMAEDRVRRQALSELAASVTRVDIRDV